MNGPQHECILVMSLFLKFLPISEVFPLYHKSEEEQRTRHYLLGARQSIYAEQSLLLEVQSSTIGILYL